MAISCSGPTKEKKRETKWALPTAGSPPIFKYICTSLKNVQEFEYFKLCHNAANLVARIFEGTILWSA